MSIHGRHAYVCRRDGEYIQTIIPYDRDRYLIDQTLVGCDDDYVCYIYPDFKSYAVTTKTTDELQSDEVAYTAANGPPASNYLASILAKYTLHSPEHVKCIVNLYHDFDGVIGEEPITVHRLEEVN